MALNRDPGTLLATIPKTPRAEVRLYRTEHAGRRVLDLRIWAVLDGSTEFVATRKGVTLDATKARLLIDALEAA